MGAPIDSTYRTASLHWMGAIGNRIRNLRKSLGLTQPVLARAVGIDQSTLSDIERGAGFSAEILLRLCDELGVTAEHLMRGSDERTWPFSKIDIARYLALVERDRSYVEGRLEAAIEKCEGDEPTPDDLARMRGVSVPITAKVARTQRKKIT